MANKLNPELIQNIAELTNVKKISDLPIIDVIEKDNETENIRTSQQFNNSYLLSSTLIEDNSQVGGRYFNYRVKLNEVTDYLSTLSDANLSVFKKTFDFFVDSLKNNTKNSYVEFIPANDTIYTENTINNYSYTFKYNLSEVHDEVIGFSYSYIEGIGEQVSTYSYTNVLTNGLVTNATLEKYVRNSIATILGVPSTPAAVSEAIDSVIEFVDWFKGYVRNDTEYGSLQNLINTIESKDAKVLDSAYSYVIKNKELSYPYTETSYNKLYGTLNNALNNINIKPKAGTNISIGEDNSINCEIGISTNNSITINGTTFSLTIDETGKFGFSEYVAIKVLTTSGGGTLETDSIAPESKRTFKVTANKNISSYTWSGSGNVTTSGTTTQIIVTQNGNNSITRKVTISDGQSSVTSSDMKLNFTSNRYFLGYSSDPNLTFTASNNGTNILSTSNYHNLKDSLSTSDIYGKGFTGNGYWYMIWPTTLNIGNIYFGAGTAKAAAAGGWHEHVQNWQEGDPVTNSNHIKVNQYSTPVEYHIYRSDHPFSVQMNIQF